MVRRKRPKDARSTQRKRARKVLLESGRDYACECTGVPGCEHEKPCGYSPNKQSRSDTLDANHINKNLFDLRPSNLEWLCRGCHKRADKRTERGVSTIADEFGTEILVQQALGIGQDGTFNLTEEAAALLHMQAHMETERKPASGKRAEFPTFE